MRRTAWALTQEQYIAGGVARQNIVDLQRCLCAGRENVNVFMVAALNERILKRWADAEHLYMLALQYDRRPELYLNLGIVQLKEGHDSAALHNLYLAGRFNREILYSDEIPPELRAAVQQRVSDEERRLRAENASSR